MFCSKCGSQNTDDAQFCKDCGAALSAPAQMQATAQNPVPKKSGKKIGIIITIIALVVIAAAVAGTFLFIKNMKPSTFKGDISLSASDGSRTEDVLKISIDDNQIDVFVSDYFTTISSDIEKREEIGNNIVYTLKDTANIDDMNDDGQILISIPKGIHKGNVAGTIGVLLHQNIESQDHLQISRFLLADNGSVSIQSYDLADPYLGDEAELLAADSLREMEEKYANTSDLHSDIRSRFENVVGSWESQSDMLYKITLDGYEGYFWELEITPE